MAQVAVEKINPNTPAHASITDDLKALADRIRQRAYELFKRRGGAEGFALDDWFTAEQDLLRMPESELVEKNGIFKVRISAAGFEAGDLKVIALPDALIVKGSVSHTHEKSDENLHFCEFDRKTLYRRFELPATIAVDKVTATLENGILQLVAPQVQTEQMKAKPGDTPAHPGTVKVKTSAAA